MHLQTIYLQDEATSGWHGTKARQRLRPLIYETAATFIQTKKETAHAHLLLTDLSTHVFDEELGQAVWITHTFLQLSQEITV